MSSSYEQAARSWVEHLRSGGTTPWSEWITQARQAEVPTGWSVPGAAQLELVRRLGLASRLDGATFARLVDVVLHRSAPGRGLAQQPLSWPEPDGAPRRFGAPPTDPSDVPVDELVRVAVGTLTELLLITPVPPAPSELTRGRFSRGPAFVLAGAPVTTSAVRRELAAAGHAEGGTSPRVVVIAEPFDQSLAQVWSARVQRGAPVRWSGFVERWANRRELPPSADFPALARRWVCEVGADNVHVLVAPHDAAAEVATGLGLAGVGQSGVGPAGRTAKHPEQQPRWRDLSVAGIDLARRVNAVLNVRAAGPDREAAVRGCATVLATVATGPGQLTVPQPFQDWLANRAQQVADDLREGGYAVLGDAVHIVPRSEGVPTGPRRDEVLRVAVEACLHQASATRKAEQR
ncbi:MAG: hypothetical protein ABIO66_11965 [Nocardioidaceae bacterium]